MERPASYVALALTRLAPSYELAIVWAAPDLGNQTVDTQPWPGEGDHPLVTPTALTRLARRPWGFHSA